ncbi:MAG: hypothetical protein WCP06_02095 [Verrucomicrobiota bacterium]
MNEVEAKSLFGQRTAVALGSILLAGFAVFAALAASDRHHRSALEHIDEQAAGNSAQSGTTGKAGGSLR